MSNCCKLRALVIKSSQEEEQRSPSIPATSASDIPEAIQDIAPPPSKHIHLNGIFRNNGKGSCPNTLYSVGSVNAAPKLGCSNISDYFVSLV